MRVFLFVLLGIVVSECTLRNVQETPSPNRWADERLWPVLEAQEQREAQTLCELLNDSSATVREAAALAFASVQDTASIPCLLAALKDDSAGVRANVVFALGFVADSLAIQRMAELAVNESDSTVQRAYLSASFLAMQRKGMLKDPNAIIYFLDRNTGQERVRAADVLRRLPDSTLRAFSAEYLALFENEPDNEVEAMLVRGLARVGTSDALSLLQFSADADKPELIIPSAIRTLGQLDDPAYDSLLFYWVGPGCIGQAALEALQGRERLDPAMIARSLENSTDTATTIGLLALKLQHADGALKTEANERLTEMARTARSPYHRAMAIGGLANALGRNPAADLLTPFIKQGPSSIERIEAFRTAVSYYKDKTTTQVELIEDVIRGSDDPGLISVVCEEILDRDKYRGFDVGFGEALTSKLAAFEMPRDLEAKMLVERTIAFVRGQAPPAYSPVPFNHPIDSIKLRALPQGQRYRISTAKGEIIIATDVNECPGSSLAFDSLVTAGYYNGKAFHRMVPNFVVQGGCPRGDGYGGMPWTLRTEIGRTPFTAGSVGLASAGRDTESCQFFITHSATPHLDGRYTRFGEVVEGMDVVWRLQVGDVMEQVVRTD